ncbi:unnamed protein product [Musa acuminata subsp. burmannicoides]
MGTSGTRLRFFAPGRFTCGFSCRPPALVSQSALAVVRKGFLILCWPSTYNLTADAEHFRNSQAQRSSCLRTAMGCHLWLCRNHQEGTGDAYLHGSC